MIKELLTGKNGYSVPVKHSINENSKRVCVIVHGFGSSKDGWTSSMLMEELPKRGIDTIAFDFPAHGESLVEGDELRIKHCLDDLSAVEEYVNKLAPQAELCYFGSSFGAYITILYLSLYPHHGKKAFFRSAAVDMPGIFAHPDAEMQRQLDEKGYFMLDYDYERPLKITGGFLEDLRLHSVFELYKRGKASIRMAHGDSDALASYELAKKFAEGADAELVTIPGGDHRLSIPGAPERVVALAAEFFLN